MAVANVALVDRNEAGLAETARRLSDTGATVLKQTIDVTGWSEIQSGIAEIAKTFKTFDLLVSCAGILVLNSVCDQTEEDWDNVLNINLKGMWMMSKATADHGFRTEMIGKIIVCLP